jgi:hypothetical protein
MSGIQSETNTRIYQAIGILGGTVVIEGDECFFQVGDNLYKIKARKKIRSGLRHGETAYFRVYPHFIDGNVSFTLIYRVRLKGCKIPDVNVFTLKGCWEEFNSIPRFVVYRNEKIGKTLDHSCHQPSALPLDWGSTLPSSDGSFWEIKAILEGDNFCVSQILGLGEPPVKASRLIDKKITDKKSSKRVSVNNKKSIPLKSKKVLAQAI